MEFIARLDAQRRVRAEQWGAALANAASAQQEAILLADMSDDPAVGRSRARSVLASSARAYESVAQEASSFVQAVNTQPTPGPCVSLSQQYAALMQAHADAARALLRPLQALSAGTVEALEATREPARQEQERALRSAEEAARNAEAAMATLCIRYQLTKPPAIEMGN